jgi:type IV secretory pathway protease TraF
MSARLACYAIALAAAASLAVSSPVKATAICDQQFNQCTSQGLPTYKCEQLRQLCESQYNVRPPKLAAAQKHETTWTSKAIEPSIPQSAIPAAP